MRCALSVRVQNIMSVRTRGTNLTDVAAARATLELVLTAAAYEHVWSLGARLADGIERVAASKGFEWRAHRLFIRESRTG
jgi:glutamate-1-semialdehyde aminotransferase